ncbi:MAG: nickel pincer cofactor biosynthesis protein LarC [Candidatus Omnitrophica bacterium]|nr:nickel pincer cofactor biosynthesis protein LarC [Candidatus Omnitrophota bacterium]
MKVAYFNCFSGAAGDMILGAFLECGLRLALLRRELAKLKLARGAFSLEARSVRRGGLKATHLEVRVKRTRGVETKFRDIERLIASSRLSGGVKEESVAIFKRLARSEAARHGKSVSQVHFHEVGAVDSLVDIVGACIARRALGLEHVYVGNVFTGKGTFQSEHGEYPVPSPAVLGLLENRRVHLSGPDTELLTPTGAAVLAEWSRDFDCEPCIKVERVGYGAGSLDLKDRPNVLTLVIGELEAQLDEDRVTVIEANIDDMLPLNYEVLFESLFEKGALDVTLTPIQMKKQRPAVQLSVIAPVEAREKVARCLLEQSTSFGVRFSDWGRMKLKRRQAAVATRHGSVKVKLGLLNGRILRASPEYEDCRRIARRLRVPLMNVYEEAKIAARRLNDKGH